MTTGYPAILILDGKLGVVVGGGAVGERKVRTLLDAGARVRVISLSVTDRVRSLFESGAIEWSPRAYAPGDLKGAAVVVASTDERDVNQAIFEEATEAGIPVNVVDDLARSTFYAPSIVRRGDLLIAISTGGANPALAVRLREKLEAEFGPEYGYYLALIRELKDTVPLASTQAERAQGWYRVVDSDVFDLVRAGEIDKARARAIELLKG